MAWCMRQYRLATGPTFSWAMQLRLGNFLFVLGPRVFPMECVSYTLRNNVMISRERIAGHWAHRFMLKVMVGLLC